MRTNRVLASATAAAVAVIAVTAATGAAAAAAAPSGSAGKGSSATVSAKPGAPGKNGDQDKLLGQIAASLHVSQAKLENALRDLKMTSIRLGVEPTAPAAVRVFAKDLGISDTKALEVIKRIVGEPGKPGDGKPGVPGADQDTLLRKIAGSLHVSLATLEDALRDMKVTSGQLGVEPTDPRVVAVFAKDLGISSTRALEVIKEIVSQPGPVKSPAPDKSPTTAPSGKG